METFFATMTDWERMLLQAAKLLTAFVFAMPIALDREKSTRIMGLRTFPLVAVASCGYVLLALGLTDGDAQAQARIVQGLITGIGFVGGGAILKDEGAVKGTATATSIWATGAVGASIAFGYVGIALLIAVLNFLVLYLLTPVKEEIDQDGEAIP